jgi:hypothetical protein
MDLGVDTEQKRKYNRDWAARAKCTAAVCDAAFTA